MMKKYIEAVSLITLIILMLLASCFVGFAQDKEIIFARPEELQWLDPYDNYNVLNSILDYLVYDHLVVLNSEPGGELFVPELATEWTISPDGKEYTFKLREDVKFHNGEPFNAESVKVSLERNITEKTLRRAYLWETLKEVEVVDDYTVTVRYSEPNVVGLVNLIYAPMLPPEALREKHKELFKNPIGTGAFTWGHWKRGQEIVLNKNPDYWGEPVHMDKFVFLPITETGTRLAGALNAEIDIADSMTSDQIPLAESSGNIEIIRMLAWDQIYLALKTDKPPFTDIKFRQAINLAIDKEGIVKHVMKGGRVSTGYIPKGIFGFDDSLVPVKQDIEKAKQLVEESVYDGRIIDIMVPIGWFPNEKEVAQAINGNLQEIGINSKMSILEGATFADRRSAGDYDIFLNQDGMGGDVNSFLTRVIATDTHGMGNINPELKELAVSQSQTVDTQKRIEILREIENIINNDFAPIIMVCQFESIYFQQKGIQGVSHYGNNSPDLRYTHYEQW